MVSSLVTWVRYQNLLSKVYCGTYIYNLSTLRGRLKADTEAHTRSQASSPSIVSVAKTRETLPVQRGSQI